MIAASAQCEWPARYLCPEPFRFINQAQYTTFGTAPASSRGSQTALIALSRFAPKERATSTNGVTKAIKKFMSDARRPHRITSTSHWTIHISEENDLALGASLIAPSSPHVLTSTIKDTT